MKTRGSFSEELARRRWAGDQKIARPCYHSGVFALRCTQKLLDRMKVTPPANSPAPSTILGDWYANILRFNRQQFILCVSERTLLPVLLPAVDARSAARRLPEGLFDVLKALGIPWGAIDREMHEMRDATIGRTANRIVLGIVNEFVYAAPFPLADGASLSSVALWLAETPCKPMEWTAPRRQPKRRSQTRCTDRTRCLSTARRLWQLATTHPKARSFII